VCALAAVPINDPDEGGNRRYGCFPLFHTEPDKIEFGLKLRRPDWYPSNSAFFAPFAVIFRQRRPTSERNQPGDRRGEKRRCE